MNFLDIEVKVDKPYPEIVNVQDDMNTVAILKNLANGRVGETPASMQYIYQSVIADKTNEQIAEIFEEIGVVEMMHLDMLMHAISLFGGVPKYEDSQGNFFNTANLNYTLKLRDMLDNNIKAESMAIENYRMAIQRVSNNSLKALFERIIEDETRHLEIFKKIRDNVEFMSV
ncbi:MAG: manganese catalase family protein [Clostridia bacterium]|nr:manganese catalase family protein [Clostridia bacterium]